MNYLIVNGDDFGASPGINRGILEAHERGILTSTSLMVERTWSEEAAALGRRAVLLSIGLHVELADPPEGHDSGAAIDRQIARFVNLLGRPPTHIDSHKNVHRSPALLASFVDRAGRWGVPLRDHGPVRHVASFYGRWGGETHPEQIGLPGLVRILDAEMATGVTELMCHPGYVDADLRSSYAVEREIELRTLCDSALPALLESRAIKLVGFSGLSRLATSATLAPAQPRP